MAKSQPHILDLVAYNVNVIRKLLGRNKGTWLNYNALVRVSTSLLFYSDSLRISVTKIFFV